MNNYWHIPRASLASSSSSAVSLASSNQSNKSYSNPPTLAKRTAIKNDCRSKIGRRSDGNDVAHIHAVTSKHQQSQSTSRRDSTLSETSAAVTAAAAAAVLATAKRGSHSSQGSSSDSNNSTRSVASGSLLLTAANLERFAEIQKQQQPKHNRLYHEGIPSIHQNANIATIATYNANLVHALHAGGRFVKDSNRAFSDNKNNNDAIITIDPNLDFIKTKDLDAVSIASSMHFTMVNGEGGGSAKKPKRGLCDRGRQVTVLIIIMSTVFLLLIMGMVYALEMRAREMPQS